MLKDKDSLICDMAEFYHVLDIDVLPVPTLAALAVGLPSHSRSKRKYSNQNIPDELGLLALILDSVNRIGWMLSKDGAKGKNRPASVYGILTDLDRKKDVEGFKTVADFEAAKNQILAKGG